MYRVASMLLIVAVLVAGLPGNVPPAHAQPAAERRIVIRVNDIFPLDTTEGGLGGVFGGTHDEPYFIVAWEIFESDANGAKSNIRRDGRLITVRDLQENEHAQDVVLWQGALKQQEQLHLAVQLMEDDGSVLRDAIGIPLVVIAVILTGGTVEGSSSCEFGHCFNEDDFIGSFDITMNGSGRQDFRKGSCAEITAIQDAPKRSHIDLSCDGHYRMDVGLFDN
jgi:hypothetical protein